MARDPRDKFGEYSGAPGSIQKAEDGHEELTAAEKRRINATYGIRNADSGFPDAATAAGAVNSGIDVDGSRWEDAEQRMRAVRMAESAKRLNGRLPGDGA